AIAAKVDAGFAAAADVVLANQVVRIAVAERHSVAALFDEVLLVEPVLRSPTEVNSFGTALDTVAANDRALRTGTGVNGQPGAVVKMTILNDHVMGDSPDDPVAIEVSDGHAADGDAVALFETDAAVVERAPVKHFIVGLIAVDREVFN